MIKDVLTLTALISSFLLVIGGLFWFVIAVFEFSKVLGTIAMVIYVSFIFALLISAPKWLEE